jgi:hypothetical protein
MLTELIFGAKNLSEADKALAELQKAGVDPLSPDYEFIQKKAKEYMDRGLKYTEILNALGEMARNDNATREAFRRSSGGNLAGELGAALTFKKQGAIAELAKTDAMLKRQGLDRYINTAQILQNQKNFNTNVFNQKAAAIGQARTAAEQTIANGITGGINTALAAYAAFKKSPEAKAETIDPNLVPQMTSAAANPFGTGVDLPDVGGDKMKTTAPAMENSFETAFVPSSSMKAWSNPFGDISSGGSVTPFKPYSYSNAG